MPISSLTPGDLRFTLDPAQLGFADTAELLRDPLPWIGQDLELGPFQFVWLHAQ